MFSGAIMQLKLKSTFLSCPAHIVLHALCLVVGWTVGRSVVRIEGKVFGRVESLLLFKLGPLLLMKSNDLLLFIGSVVVYDSV